MATGTSGGLLDGKNPDFHTALKLVIDKYIKQGLRAQFLPGNIEDHLNAVVHQAVGAPLFLFLDPCGAGLPYAQFRDVPTGPRLGQRPQTEVLLNFNAGITRRATGALNKGMLEERIIPRMDTTCGGGWWRKTALDTLHSPQGKNFEAAAHAVAEEYGQRIAKDTSMKPVVIPVARSPRTR